MERLEESLHDRLERIKRQNAEIVSRHLEVEEDKKRAARDQAQLIKNSMSNNDSDLMPAERAALRERPLQRLSNRPSAFIEKQPPVNLRLKESQHNIPARAQLRRPHKSVAVEKLRLSYNSEPEDEEDIFADVKPLSPDSLVDDGENKSGEMENLQVTVNFQSSGTVTKSISQENDRLPQASIPSNFSGLENENSESPEEGSTAPLQFFHTDLSVPPPPLLFNVSKNDPVPSLPLVSPTFTTDPEMFQSDSQMFPRNFADQDSSFPDYSKAAQLNFPGDEALSLGHPAAPSKHPFAQANVSPPEASTAYSDNLPELPAMDSFCHYSGNGLPSVNHMARMLNAMPDSNFGPLEAFSSLDAKPCQIADGKIPYSSEPVLNVAGIPFSKSEAESILETVVKAMQNSESPNLPHQLVREKSFNRKVSNEPQANQTHATRQYLNNTLNNFGSSFPTSQDNAWKFSQKQVPNVRQEGKMGMNRQNVSFDSKNIPRGYGRPILGRGASDQLPRNIDQVSITSDSSSDSVSVKQHRRSVAAPKRKSALQARMDAVRNENSHRFSRSNVHAQANHGVMEVSYKGNLTNVSSSQEPDSDCSFASSDVREKDRLIEIRRKELNNRKSRLQEKIQQTVRENAMIEEKLMSLRLQTKKPNHSMHTS